MERLMIGRDEKDKEGKLYSNCWKAVKTLLMSTN